MDWAEDEEEEIRGALSTNALEMEALFIWYCRTIERHMALLHFANGPKWSRNESKAHSVFIISQQEWVLRPRQQP